MPLVYIVDDDFDIIHSISTWLRHRQYTVQGFSGSKPLFEAIDTTRPDIILLDVRLGVEDGRDVCRQIRNRYADHIPIVLFSMAFNSMEELKDSCADDFIRKDETLREITALLQAHINIEKE